MDYGDDVDPTFSGCEPDASVSTMPAYHRKPQNSRRPPAAYRPPPIPPTVRHIFSACPSVKD